MKGFQLNLKTKSAKEMESSKPWVNSERKPRILMPVIGSITRSTLGNKTSICPLSRKLPHQILLLLLFNLPLNQLCLALGLLLRPLVQNPVSQRKPQSHKKVPMKKPLGYLLMNLLMLLTSSLTSISNIHPNLALFTFSKTLFIFLFLCYHFFISVYSLFILFLNSVIHTKKTVKEKNKFKFCITVPPEG